MNPTPDVVALQAALDAGPTPGEWGWWRTGNWTLHLTTQRHGKLIVMDFERQGMQGSTPRFAMNTKGGYREGLAGGLMVSPKEMGEELFEAHPDAQWLAIASPERITRVLAALRAAEQLASDRLDQMNADRKQALRWRDQVSAAEQRAEAAEGLLRECEDAIAWCAQECGHHAAAQLAAKIDAALKQGEQP